MRKVQCAKCKVQLRVPKKAPIIALCTLIIANCGEAAKMCQMSTAANFFASYAYSCDNTNWATSYQHGTAPYNCADSYGSTDGSLLKATGAEYTTLPASSWKVWGSSTSQSVPTVEGIHYCADDSWAYRTSQRPAAPGAGSYGGYNGPSGDRHFCMCQVLKINGVKSVGAWRLHYSEAKAADCSAYCANNCGAHVFNAYGWRVALLGLQP